MILKDDFDFTKINDIKTLYNHTYYSVAIQLLEKGLTEADIRAKYRKALIFFCKQQKQVAFDHQNLDIVLYLYSLCLLE